MPSLLFRVVALIGIFIALTSHASPSEPAPNLIALIPPDAALVAGIEARHRDPERPDLFIPLPGKSLRDFDYFNSLCGADPVKLVNEVIFVDGDLNRSEYDHTLLARGRFNSQILYRSASSKGAIRKSYRGLAVLQLPPLARERSEFNEFTWVAIIDSRVVLLGTPQVVRQEMDRLVAGNAPDPLFAEHITAVQRNDVWWILRQPIDTLVVKDELTRLSPDFGELLTQPNLGVGMRYGRQVVFEYQAGISAPPTPTSAPGFTLLEPPELTQFVTAFHETIRSHGVIKIARERYRQWVAEIATRPISF